MGFTDGGLVEPLILLAVVLILAACAVWATAGLLRLASARRHAVENPRKVLAVARDALAAVISDPGTGDSNRSQALAAYEAVSGAIQLTKKGNS